MSLTADISVLLVGAGGYGQSYVEALLGVPGYGARVVGVVEPKVENLRRMLELSPDTPVFISMDEFYARHSADLAVISTPFHMHRAHCVTALEHGSHVLCEKPLCSTMEDAREIIKARDRTGRFVAVGYQWCYSAAVQELKGDVISGLLGKPKRLKTLVLTPRNESYYRRAPWAGRVRDDSGAFVFDSVAANACAHYLFNMMFILGGSMSESALPDNVTAELYRANDIENYDTAAARIWTRDGVQLLFYASHATREELGPIFHYEFTGADVYFDTDWEGRPDDRNPAVRKGNIWASFHDGSYKVYDSPNACEMRKLEMSLHAARGEPSILCTPEAAIAHTACITGMQKSEAGILVFPDTMLGFEPEGDAGEGRRFVHGLGEALSHCFDSGLLPHETGLRWAGQGRSVGLQTQC